MDDPLLLSQDIIGDYLEDYPPEIISDLWDVPELHCYTLSGGAECNLPTAPVGISEIAPGNNSDVNNDEPNDQHSPVQKVSSSSPEEGVKGQSGEAAKATKRPKRLPEQCQHHIIAERQRRQTLTQRFIALSALIPGLKKMDKTSVLGEAITHMKQLKEKLKLLEDESARKAVDSVVVVKRSQVTVENDSNSSTTIDSSAAYLTRDELPQVEVRFFNRNVLVRIHCPMQTGVLSKIITQIENLNLVVNYTSTLTFNDTTLDITITTQMEPDFDMRPKEVVANLRSVF